MIDEFTRYSNTAVIKSKSSTLNVYIKNWLSVYLEHARSYLVTVEEIQKYFRFLFCVHNTVSLSCQKQVYLMSLINHTCL